MGIIAGQKSVCVSILAEADKPGLSASAHSSNWRKSHQEKASPTGLWLEVVLSALQAGSLLPWSGSGTWTLTKAGASLSVLKTNWDVIL